MSWQLGATVFGTGLTIFTWVASMMGLPIPRLVLGLLLVGSLWLMAVWPVAWLVRVSSGYKTQLIICAIVGAILTSLSYGIIEYSLLPSETPTVQTGVQPQPPLRSTYNLFEPVVELGIGKPFDSSTLITIKNAGVEPIIHVAANLRCFFLKTDKDMVPDLFFEGFPSIGNANSWWSIDVIEPNGIETKDAMESVTRCLSNSEKHPGRVFARQIFSIDLL